MTAAFTGLAVASIGATPVIVDVDARRLTLVALFNREREPDGPGGTAHLVRVASERGCKPVVLDARVLLEG